MLNQNEVRNKRGGNNYGHQDSISHTPVKEFETPLQQFHEIE